MAITTIAFDLDDTLLNTSGLLVPEASRQAFSILIAHGLSLTLEECEAARLKDIQTISHKDLFLKLAADYGTTETRHYITQAISAFYDPVIPEKLPLVPGVKELLPELKNKYHLYIVTAGFENSQKNKIRSLQIENFFKKIFVVNSLNNERKISAFKQILDLEKIPPENLLCVGNSLSSEIKDAKELGAIACYFEFGENRGKVSDDVRFKPNYHIKDIHHLIQTCKL